MQRFRVLNLNIYYFSTPQRDSTYATYWWWSFSKIPQPFNLLCFALSSSLHVRLPTYRLINAAVAALYIPLAPTTPRRERDVGLFKSYIGFWVFSAFERHWPLVPILQKRSLPFFNGSMSCLMTTVTSEISLSLPLSLSFSFSGMYLCMCVF